MLAKRLLKVFKKNKYLIGIIALVNVLVLSLFSVILLGIFSGVSFQKSGLEASGLQSNVQSITESLSGYVFNGESDVVPIVVESAEPAVVSVSVTGSFSEDSAFDSNNGLQNFFNFFVPGRQGSLETESGGGSGFIVSPDGLVVTNRHVVKNERASYSVFLSDGRRFDAEVVARDPLIDLAILQIDGNESFPFLSFGESSDLKLGETVIAIGNALGEFRNSVSVGVVSGLSRTVVAGDSTGGNQLLEEVIQTDAAINFGNSGGPLINTKGEVVGVNVARIFGGDNIGFALPSHAVKGVVESVKKHGRIVYPFLGVRYVKVNEDVVRRYNLPIDYGFLVTSGRESQSEAVVSGSPAERAGIKEGDVILGIDGLDFKKDSLSLGAVLRQKEIGERVKFDILRQGRKISVVAELGNSP